jgi:hypothetical protein
MQVMSDWILIPSLHPFLSWLPRCSSTVKITAVSGLSHMKLQVITSHLTYPVTSSHQLDGLHAETAPAANVRIPLQILHYLSPPTGGWPWVIYERVCVVGMDGPLQTYRCALPCRRIPISFLRRERGNLIE